MTADSPPQNPFWILPGQVSSPHGMPEQPEVVHVDSSLVHPTKVPLNVTSKCGTPGSNMADCGLDLDQLKMALQAAVLVVIFLASLLTNCLVFVVFYRKPSLLNISNR